MLQVPFFICRYLLLNIQVPFSTRQQAIHGTVPFTPDILTPHTAFTSLPATVPIFWNVSTYFFYPCAHSVVASSTRCHRNRRKLSTYRETRPPSWENGTWQVPSQLSHRALMIVIIYAKYEKNPSRTVDATERTRFSKSRPNDLEDIVEVKDHHMRHTLSCYWSFVPNMERIHPEL